MKIHIKKGDQVLGPFSKDELSDKIYSGEFPRSVLACVEGSTDWVSLESLLATAKAPPVVTAPPPVTADQLCDPKEKTALIWLYIASVPMWLFLLSFVVLGMGIPLIIIGVFWLFHLFGELWFAAYLKTNAIRVSERQLPELN